MNSSMILSLLLLIKLVTGLFTLPHRQNNGCIGLGSDSSGRGLAQASMEGEVLVPLEQVLDRVTGERKTLHFIPE